MLSYDLINDLKVEINEKLIKRVASVLTEVKKIKQANFVLVLVSGSEIKKINKKYRKKDKVTDVLSFATCDERDFFPGEDREKNNLGEILICFTQLKRQAKEYGWSIDHEFVRLLIHGLAHLLGYEHENVSQKKIKEMEKFEKDILNKVLVFINS